MGAMSRGGQLDRAMFNLLEHTPEIEAAAVVSFDGLPMASALPESMDEDRVAAMSAALLSLGERAANGLGRGDLSQVFIEGDDGTVFLVSCDGEAVLVAVAAKGAKTGLMLYEVKRTAAVIGKTLATEYAEAQAAQDAELADEERSDIAEVTEAGQPEPATAVAPPATPVPSSYIGAAVEAQGEWYPEVEAAPLPAQPGFPTPPAYVPYGSTTPDGNGHGTSWS
jgi:predicted regulator of Ras-like GTPase activity (Roadblock/LC7/MglB family)